MTQTRAEKFAVFFRLLRISSGFFLALFILLLWGRLELVDVLLISLAGASVCWFLLSNDQQIALNSLSFLVKMTIMGWVVVVVQGRYMLFIPAGFHFRFASSVLGIALLGLSACQPVFQAQTGRTVPVVFPAESQTGPVSQAENEADDLTPSSTLLTEEEASAEPVEATAVLIPHTDPVQEDQTPVQSESQTDEAVIVISRSPPPAQPVVLPAFNPADLVGNHNHLSMHSSARLISAVQKALFMFCNIASQIV